MPVGVPTIAAVDMNMPVGVGTTGSMWGVLPFPVPVIVAATPVMIMDIFMVGIIDTFNRMGVFDPLGMPVIMTAIVRVMMDMPVMVGAI